MKIDLTPAGVQFSTLIEVVRDAALGHLTPCREYCVGDLLDHIAGITVAFGGAAVKAGGSQRTWDPQEMQQTYPDWRKLCPNDWKFLLEHGRTRARSEETVS